ncbi:response regulator [Fusibacter sp. JL298sf-3]
MAGIKTIIIDDSDFFRKFLTDVCKDLGFEVIADFPRGDRFLEELQAGRFLEGELLLLDINMPGRLGTDLIEDILDASPELIIIMISTLNTMKMVDKSLSLGATNYITKDASPSEIKETIRKTLKMNGFTL